ncbi:hypothetical protein R6Q57_009584 [Mikania cordata]
MLPWLVIPLIGLWLLSQFLPPAFRFEITSPRLACVLVLLATLFWYEILMPQLSSWRARRNARLKEKKRLEAIEMQKLRKIATRLCRNCKTPYRDQNPSGGKFMCSYCGHSSKRPLFDPSVSPGLEPSGVIKGLVGKVWSDNNWVCGQDWLENGGYWVNDSFTGKSSYWKKNNGGFLNSGNDHFFSFLLVFVCKSLAAVFTGIVWLFRKLFRISFSEDEDSSDTDVNGVTKMGESGVNGNETRSEKARRKAEEKRQARLEREQLEEEERKQREEVARLVEERRKLRDEIDKKTKVSTRDKTDGKEAERKRQERKREKDKGSSKSNSDVDELEKRASKEIERKTKGEADYREHYKPKAVLTNNYNKGSVGARYIDRMKGNFFPSSRTITGGFFGKGVNANASDTRDHKSNAYFDQANKRDFVQPERVHEKLNAYAGDQNQNRPVVFESQPCPPPKRSWHQLFTRSSPPVSSPTTNITSIPNPNKNPQTESKSSIPSSVYPLTQGFDNPVSYGLPFPLSYADSTSNTHLQFSAPLEHGKPEKYEDPCFVADPVSSIGSVSDSLENFPIDLGFLADVGTCEEKHADSAVFPRTQEKTTLPLEDRDPASDKGWQMWDSSFSPDTLGLVGGNTNWLSPQKTTNRDDPWPLRTSYGSISSNNDRLSMNLQENGLFYGIPNGSAFNHLFQPSNGNVWAKKEKGSGPVCVESIGGTSAAPGDGLYSTHLQMYSPFGQMNDKKKDS